MPSTLHTDCGGLVIVFFGGLVQSAFLHQSQGVKRGRVSSGFMPFPILCGTDASVFACRALFPRERPVTDGEILIVIVLSEAEYGI